MNKKGLLKRLLAPAAAMCLLLTGNAAHAVPALIAGVDFEGANNTVFNTAPDDLISGDGVTVSSGNGTNLFNGWTLVRTNGQTSGAGNLRNDAGANGAGATTPDFPARLEGATIGSWSLFIADDVVLNLDRIEFDVRGATGGATGTGANSGRAFQFNTSLDGANILASNSNLNGRNAGFAVFTHFNVDLTGPLYQGLTDQSIAFQWNAIGAIDIDTIRVFGTTAPVVNIPEPATAALGLMGLGGLMMRRRRMA